jgi:tRNA (adenine37-N6)-methyltransferase
VESYVELGEALAEECLLGLAAFSHVEVIYHFHLVDPGRLVLGAEHPRENPAWPRVGIFAQRKKARPNRIGATVALLERVEGRRLYLRHFDAIDGTPVLDIKPVMAEYLPREAVRQPEWASELMRDYWRKGQ